MSSIKIENTDDIVEKQVDSIVDSQMYKPSPETQGNTLISTPYRFNILEDLLMSDTDEENENDEKDEMEEFISNSGDRAIENYQATNIHTPINVVSSISLTLDNNGIMDPELDKPISDNPLNLSLDYPDINFNFQLVISKEDQLFDCNKVEIESIDRKVRKKKERKMDMERIKLINISIPIVKISRQSKHISSLLRKKRNSNPKPYIRKSIKLEVDTETVVKDGIDKDKYVVGFAQDILTNMKRSLRSGKSKDSNLSINTRHNVSSQSDSVIVGNNHISKKEKTSNNEIPSIPRYKPYMSNYNKLAYSPPLPTQRQFDNGIRPNRRSTANSIENNSIRLKTADKVFVKQEFEDIDKQILMIESKKRKMEPANPDLTSFLYDNSITKQAKLMINKKMKKRERCLQVYRIYRVGIMDCVFSILLDWSKSDVHLYVEVLHARNITYDMLWYVLATSPIIQNTRK